MFLVQIYQPQQSYTKFSPMKLKVHPSGPHTSIGYFIIIRSNKCWYVMSHAVLQYTHLWKQTSTFGIREFELDTETFTFTVCASFLRFLILNNPWIYTLSQTTTIPGLVPGESFTGKPRDSCKAVDSETTEEPIIRVSNIWGKKTSETQRVFVIQYAMHS